MIDIDLGAPVDLLAELRDRIATPFELTAADADRLVLRIHPGSSLER